MIRAVKKARVGVFLLSPQFAAKEWPMKEIMMFLKKHEDEREEERPVLLPAFCRKSIGDCYSMYEDDNQFQEVVEENNFFAEERQRECSTTEAKTDLEIVISEIRVESTYMRDGATKGDAVVLQEVFTCIRKSLERL